MWRRGRKIVPIIGAYLCAALMICAPLASHPFPQAATQPPAVRVSTKLIEVNVIVQDSKGEPVSGLTKDDFAIYDKGKRQEIAFFSEETNESISTRFCGHCFHPGRCGHRHVYQSCDHQKRRCTQHHRDFARCAQHAIHGRELCPRASASLPRTTPSAGSRGDLWAFDATLCAPRFHQRRARPGKRAAEVQEWRKLSTASFRHARFRHGP